MTGRTITYLKDNALGALALFVALGGTSFAAAGGFAASSGRLQTCVRADGSLALLKAGKHCKRGQKQLAWNVRGPQGPQGAPGRTGSAGASGQTGPQGAPGSALAYAHVTKAGTLDAANSKNVTDARPSVLGEGATCVYGSFTPHNAVGTVAYGLGEGTGHEAVTEITLDPTFTLSLCPSSASGTPAVAMVIVRDFTNEKADPADAGYDIVFN